MSEPQPPDHEAPIIATMEQRFDLIVDDMLRRSQTVPIYQGFTDPAFVAAARAHCEDHMRAFLTVARERRLLDATELDFVVAQAAMRARQGVPLDALLHVYRMGHEAIFQGILACAGESRAGMAGALALTGRTLPHVDLITTMFTERYLETQHQVEADAANARRDLIDRALRGAIRPAEAADRARELGIDPEGPFVVAVCAPSGTARPSAEDLRRVADRLGGRGGHLPGRAVVGVVRDREVIALFAAATPTDELRDIVERAIADPSARFTAGVSLPCDDICDVQRGYADAWSMLRRATPGTARCLAQLSPTRYLEITADETVGRLIDPAVNALFARDAAAGGQLIATLATFADTNLNAAATAQVLHLHPNSVRYRLTKVRRGSGLDPYRFHDLVELLAAARLLGLDGSVAADSASPNGTGADRQSVTADRTPSGSSVTDGGASRSGFTARG